MPQLSCPPENVWQAFLLDALGDTDAAAILDHLEQCATCEAVVRRLEQREHSTVEGVRRAYGGSADRLAAARRRSAHHEAQGRGRTEDTVPAALRPEDAVDPTRPAARKAEMLQVARADDPPTLASSETGVQAHLAWQPGTLLLGLYEVQGVIGEGGMGTVYKVHHRGWDLDLAVKSPRPQILARAGSVENFEREAETWVKLGLHPHVVSCYYVRRLDGVPRVFAEYVSGGSLEEWIRGRQGERGPLFQGSPAENLERIFDIAIQFAWGLQHAHEHGVIHQDVKPQNVMMTADGLAKVTDFGLARAVPAAGEGFLVSAGGMTPAYCSPEQAAGAPCRQRRTFGAGPFRCWRCFLAK